MTLAAAVQDVMAQKTTKWIYETLFYTFRHVLLIQTRCPSLCHLYLRLALLARSIIISVCYLKKMPITVTAWSKA
jgi:hypothetical protein